MSAVPSARPRLLLIDTNLLLLLLVGSYDRQLVARFGRTRAYTNADFDLLTNYATDFSGIILTPNVVTEVSNLAGHLSEPARQGVFDALANLVQQAEERYYESKKAVEDLDFRRFGVTDVSIKLAALENVAVLTDDLKLYHKLSASGITIVNFNHVRAGAL